MEEYMTKDERASGRTAANMAPSPAGRGLG
jgi:hypothetical protein